MFSTQQYFGFDPRTIPGCSLWFDGLDPNGNGTVPANNAALSTWVDKSGTGNSGTAIGTTPLYQTNSGVLFSTGGYSTSYSASLANESMFFVYTPTSVPDTITLAGPNDTGGRTITVNTSLRLESSSYFVGFGSVSPNSTVTLNQRCQSGYINTASSTVVVHNGTTYSAVSLSYTAGRTTKIGVSGTTNAIPFKGTIHEVIAYNVALTASQRQQLEGYLAWKWGIASPPTTIPTSGLSLWLDAADSSTITFASGSNISQWSDKSGSGNHATQSLAGRYPTYSSANRRVDFTRTSNNYFLLPNNALPTGNSSYTYYMMICFTNTLDGMGVIGGGTWGTNNGTFAYRSFNTNGQMIMYWYNNDLATPVSSYTANTPLMIMTDWNGTTRTIVKNGTQIATNNPGTARNQGSSNNAIGTTNNLNEFMEGFMNEIIVFNRALTSNENRQVEGYLAWKWGLQSSLPSGHPFAVGSILPVGHPYRYFPNFQRLPSPLDFGPMLFWWDSADYGTFTPASPTAGTSITGWRDKINSVTLSNSNASPTWQTNGVRFTNPSSTISASSQNLIYLNDASPYTLTQNFTVLVAHSPNLSNDFQMSFSILANRFLSGVPGFTAWIQCGTSEGNTVGAISNGNWIQLQQATRFVTTLGQPRIDSVLSASSNFVWTNGTENTYSLNNIGRGATLAGSNTIGLITMSSISNSLGSRAYDGTIHEVLVYSSNLSSNAIRQVEGYLAWKWNVRPNLVSTHPFFRIPTSSPLFTPTNLSNLVLWLDAADSSTITGNPVTTWADKSGNGRNATSPAGPTVSTYNGRQVLAFNGTSQYMISTSTTVSRNAHTLIAVHVPANINGNYQGNTSLFRFQQASGYLVFPYQYTTTPRGYITSADGSGAGSIDFANSTLLDNSVTTQLNLIVANIASGNQRVFRNGTQQAATTQSLSAGTTDYLTIGAFGTAAEFYQGNLAEMMIFSSALSTREQQQIEGYLAWKWGLQNNLPTTHPYYKFRP